MEEAQEILLNSLENSGVPIPPGVSSIQDLTPTSLVLICSQSLRIIDNTFSLPTSLPDSMAERFKICTELAEAIKNLGYIGDMSFNKFLYPSEEDLYKLVRFLVEKLSESSEEGKHVDKENINARKKLSEDNIRNTFEGQTERADTRVENLNHENVGEKLKEMKVETEVPESSRRDASGNEETFLELEQKRTFLKEVELEMQSVFVEIRKREEEHSKLAAELEKQPKVASRRSYIERITEITKNSRKQDADIERILKETRELQLESNSIQERLHRTYAVVDETVFREAKKDPVGREAYKLLTSIHESFELMYEKVLSTDRTRREVAEYEAKLAAMASRSLNVDKLQADLDAIRKENEYLEKKYPIW